LALEAPQQAQTIAAEDRIFVRVSRMIDRLPGLSTTVHKVLETCNDPTASANDLNRVISLDPVLTGRLLKLVNSAYYGLPQTVSAVTRAVILLGLNTVKHLALSLAILENFYSRRSFPAFSADDFWAHSLCVGAASKSLAMVTGAPRKDVEEYFVAGLLHDLGKIPLHKCAPHQGQEAVSLACQMSWPLPEAERAVLGVDHCTVGRLLAGKWRLSPRVTAAMVHHHQPDDVSEENRSFVVLVALANRFANIGRFGFAGDCAVDESQEDILQSFGLGTDYLSALHAAVTDEYEKAKVFLEVATGERPHAG